MQDFTGSDEAESSFYDHPDLLGLDNLRCDIYDGLISLGIQWPHDMIEQLAAFVWRRQVQP